MFLPNGTAGRFLALCVLPRHRCNRRRLYGNGYDVRAMHLRNELGAWRTTHLGVQLCARRVTPFER